MMDIYQLHNSLVFIWFSLKEKISQNTKLNESDTTQGDVFIMIYAYTFCQDILAGLAKTIQLT